ncbi:MAG: FAD:protein FMN transferase [Bacteroidales bacterium]
MYRLFTILISLYIVLPGCKPREYFFLQGTAQGTSYQIKYADAAAIDYSEQVDSILDAFDMSLSTYKPNSIISRMNMNDAAVRADEWFTEVFNKAMEVSEATGGAFDITVGPLVNAWGFGRDSIPHVDSIIIDSLLELVGYKKVSLAGNRLIKADPRMYIDVNALAQGYSCDVLATWLEAQGIKHYMIDVGGEVRVRGKNPDGNAWRIGIDRPVMGNMIPGEQIEAVVALKNKSLATSGNYRKYYEVNGVKYAHTINPHTGYPVMQNLLSASIIASDCMTADAYATACMVMGLEKSKELLENHPELQGLLIYSDEKGQYRIWKTRKFPME